MSRTDYSAIEPLVADQQVDGSRVSVTFRCPQTEIEVPATGSIKKDTGIAADATRKTKKGLWNSLRRSVSRAITDALGSGTAGRVARDVANSAMSQKASQTSFSKGEIQSAVVSAFESVQSKFQWVDDQWVGVQEPTTAFARRLQEAPVTETYDKGVLARALVELSAADGEIGDEERAFLGGFIDRDIGSIDELAQRDKLTAAELGETNESVRASILMLSWATAMCDEELADAEASRLEELATGLGLAQDVADAVRSDAQRFLFEQALNGVYADGSRDAEAFAAATEAAGRMGLDGPTIEQFDANYRKRCGII